MRIEEVDAMPKALRLLADQITAPDHVPAMCLRDAAAMIESMRMQIADAIRRPMGVVPHSADWLPHADMEAAENRRVFANAQAHQTPERSVGGMVPPVVGNSGQEDRL